MKIAICDDDKQALFEIIRLVDEYFSCSLPDEKIEVRRFESSVELSDQLESGKYFDLFLLDIIMPTISGIELAAKIRKTDQVAKIIFLTTSPEFAVKSYSVDAFQYLLKPIEKAKLFSVLEKASTDIYSNLRQYIAVKTQSGLSKVFFRELIYVEVIEKTVYFHQKSGVTIESSTTLSQVEAVLLKDKRFIKPHRSYIVNLDHIKHLSQKGFTTTSDLFIPITRSVLKEVKQTYIHHLFQTED